MHRAVTLTVTLIIIVTVTVTVTVTLTPVWWTGDNQYDALALAVKQTVGLTISYR